MNQVSIKLPSVWVFASLPLVIGVAVTGCGAPAEQDGESFAAAEDEIVQGTCNYAPGSTVTITQSTILPKACVLRKVQFVIKASNITFDCNNAVLHGLANQDAPNPYGIPYDSSDMPRDRAFMVTATEGKPAPANITIKNCVVKNYVEGARVNITLLPATIATLRTTAAPQPIEDALRLNAPQNVTFQNMHIDYAHGSALYVNRYAVGTQLLDSVITHAGHSGIYLESGTTGAQILRNDLRTNGYYDLSSVLNARVPKVVLREAIAVDSSSKNTIRGNTFSDNAGGGVFLYKNCWENHGSGGQLPRNMHSSDNVIDANTFTNEEVGVWIASRQARDLDSFDCGDPAVYTDSSWFTTERYYRDYAERTTVTGNTFHGVEQGVLVEDDAATIVGNQFDGSASQGIVVGSEIRGLHLGRPVKGAKVTDNSFNNALTYPVENMYGTSGGVFTNNTQKGAKADATCAVFTFVPAQDVAGKSCQMEPTDLFGTPSFYSRASGTTLDLRDTTTEKSAGVWGRGTFHCNNGAWTMQSGYCCFGPSCAPG
jgi:parallel beta-helix repeat protein